MIEFESVGKTFRDGTVAVVDLNLTVPSDKITVIVGPSGCGKTTTLRMVNRMLEPTTGRITWDGVPLRSKRKTTLRRQMGYVIQSGGLFPHRTVLDNISTVPALLHWPKKKIEKRCLELLDSVGLGRKLAHRYPAQLSGGQQQRVGVARALAADPLVLLMDEPFSAVDPVVRSELQEFFLGLQRELSKTIILITHDIEEAIKLGDQVAIMRIGGQLAQVGTPQQLLDEPVDAFVEGFVGRDRGFRSLSFQPASELSLERIKVVRDVEAATGPGPILVVDGDARPVGWADRERPGRVLSLGSTFSPETDSLRVALDSALTSPYGLAVAVTADTHRYAGVVSADTILDKVQDVRVSIAESISIRSGEAGQEEVVLEESEAAYEPQPADSHQSDEEVWQEPADGSRDSTTGPVEAVYDWQAESAETGYDQTQSAESVYDWQAESVEGYEPEATVGHTHQVDGEITQLYEPADELDGVYDPEGRTVRTDDREDETGRADDREDETGRADDREDETGRADEPEAETARVEDPEDQTAQADEPEAETAQVEESDDEPTLPQGIPREDPNLSETGVDETNVYDSQAAVELSQEIETHENGASRIGKERPESIMEPARQPPVQDHRRADEHREEWEAMGKALYRGGSGVLQ